MDPNVAAVLGVFMRWVHILSAITILGGFVYARFVVAPALAGYPPGEATAISNRTYTIQYRSDLVSGLWIKVVDVPAQGSSGPLIVNDPGIIVTPGPRYYRLVTPKL